MYDVIVRFPKLRMVWLGAFVGACLTGCGASGLKTKDVRGKITFRGAPPPANGKITFAPIEPAAHFPRRAASGNFDTTGEFTLTTFEEGDGIIPGRYQANIACWRELPTLETRLSANYVPPDFKYELEIKEDADEPIEVNIDIPKIQSEQSK